MLYCRKHNQYPRVCNTRRRYILTDITLYPTAYSIICTVLCEYISISDQLYVSAITSKNVAVTSTNSLLYYVEFFLFSEYATHCDKYKYLIMKF